MKTCNVCHKEKDFTEFTKRARMGDGFEGSCKQCNYVLVVKRRRTRKGLVKNIYNNQKTNSKRRGHTPPTYSLAELVQFFKDSPIANELYRNWKLSGYRKGLAPSIDRIDDSYGYSLGNIKLMTWDENDAKGRDDVKSGRMKKCSNKAVVQKDIHTGKIIATYHSGAEAERIIGIPRKNISSACTGQNKSAGGFRWSYA